MGRSRAWWRCFLAVQAAVIALCISMIVSSWTFEPVGQRAILMCECGPCRYSVHEFRGYPLTWQHSLAQHETIDDSLVSRASFGENVAIPFLLLAIAFTLPWVLFSFPKNRYPTRVTRIIRIACLCSVATLAFTVGDIATGQSGLTWQYENNRYFGWILKDKRVHSLVEKVRIARKKEFEPSPGTAADTDGKKIDRYFARRTCGCFLFLAAFTTPIYRPWCQYDWSVSVPDFAAPPNDPLTASAPRV